MQKLLVDYGLQQLRALSARRLAALVSGGNQGVVGDDVGATRCSRMSLNTSSALSARPAFSQAQIRAM